MVMVLPSSCVELDLMMTMMEMMMMVMMTLMVMVL